MAGISNSRWLFLLAILFAALSCVKEESLEEPLDGDVERFAEFDPVVHFGLDTYMGPDNTTKTTYAGDGNDKTYKLDNVRYERINWNGKSVKDPDDPNYQDVIQIISQTNFTPKNNKTSVSYKVEEIAGLTNPNDNSREDQADAKPYSDSSDDNFYWSRPPAGSTKDAKYYFYAVYPTPESSIRPSTKVTNFLLANTTDPNPANHLAMFSGSISKRVGTDPGADDPCRKQEYLDVISYTDGLLGKGQTCYEYLPDMKNAYLYAASVMPGADAGYKKVPLRFKPLYSAVKLIVTADDAGAKNYRLKRVDLRTDLHNNGSKEGRRDLNDAGVGTALGGSFSTYFKADASSGTTADFAKIDPANDPLTAYGDTLKRLFIEIDEGDRFVLGDDVLKLTFLVLPIEQKVMTVDYTFEYLKGSELNPSDPGYRDPAIAANWQIPDNVVELHRYLSLQQKTDKTDNTGLHNEFSGNDWYKLPAASKLYVRSKVPEIQYYFDVIVQGDFPRTWKDGSPKPAPKTGESFPAKDFFEAKDFYAVISYRDSSGFKQPLRWKVTGYRPEGAVSFSPTKPVSVSWLNLRGDGPWKMLAPFDVDDAKHPGYPYTDTGYSFDPWDLVQGQGTKMKNPVDKDKNPVLEGSRALVGYLDFDTNFYNFYDAGAPNNGARSWGWVNHGSYIHSTPDGEFVHHVNDGVAYPDSTGWLQDKAKREAYAYDLSSHDIYGNLTADFNGDINHATTANCYVVSSPGWYRFPAVYGNALKGGADNTTAYNKGSPNDPTSGIMGAYLDYKDQEITGPWIPYSIKSVSVVWDDANRMVSKREDAATRMDRRPFCETIDGKQYIYFYVDDIAQGNALIAAKDASGTILWSWHIWAVTNPEESLATIELESNQTVLDPYSPLDGINRTTVMPNSFNFTDYPSATQAPMEFPFAKRSSVKNIFWRRADLGQNGKETGAVALRYCDVEFTQYFKGKVVAKVVRRFLQSGVEDDYSITPVYQWGRKDPMRTPKTSSVQLTDADIGTPLTGRTIQNPEDFYFGDSSIPITGVRYDNLWNNNITIAVSDSRCDDERNQFPGASKDRNVAKTIYDPSPAGFVMPNMYAFSAFNPYGTINQTRFPAQKIGEIAYNAASTFKTDGTGYIDFYAKYDASAPYKRKKDPDQTIRIFVSGRLNGINNSTARANLNLLYLWTSEPAVWNGYYGRSLCSQGALTATGAWNFNPVTGVSAQELSDPTDPSSPLTPNISNGAQAKWQRSHAEPVRPMVEQP